MKISFTDISQIYTAMGKHLPYLAVEGEDLKLQWWTNEHQLDLVVTDFSGHRGYFDPFMKKILLMTKGFEAKVSCPFRKESKQFLLLCNAYLGENNIV